MCDDFGRGQHALEGPGVVGQYNRFRAPDGGGRLGVGRGSFVARLSCEDEQLALLRSSASAMLMLWTHGEAWCLPSYLVVCCRPVLA
jgi:hypothetical protein